MSLYWRTINGKTSFRNNKLCRVIIGNSLFLLYSPSEAVRKQDLPDGTTQLITQKIQIGIERSRPKLSGPENTRLASVSNETHGYVRYWGTFHVKLFVTTHAFTQPYGYTFFGISVDT